MWERSPLFVAYGAVALCTAIGESIALPLLSLVAKPLAMPLLFIQVAKACPKSTRAYRIYAVLLFSWIGDILLLFAPDASQSPLLLGIPRDSGFFLGGLGSFFVAQLFYVSLLLRKPQYFPWWGYGGIVAWGLGMATYLWVSLLHSPEKTALRIPVALYAGALTAMYLAAASRYGHVGAPTFWRGFWGATLFVLSDSLIGLNYLAWERPLPAAGAAIFLTYAAAQWLLMSSLCEEAQRTQPPINR